MHHSRDLSKVPQQSAGMGCERSPEPHHELPKVMSNLAEAIDHVSDRILRLQGRLEDYSRQELPSPVVAQQQQEFACNAATKLSHSVERLRDLSDKLDRMLGVLEL